MIGFMKKDVAELLSNGHDKHAFGRVSFPSISLMKNCIAKLLEQTVLVWVPAQHFTAELRCSAGANDPGLGCDD
jgi:hypothetical protein